MIKKLLLLCLCSSPLVSNAATVTFSAGATAGFFAKTSEGTQLGASSGVLAIGNFAILPTITDQASMIQALADFRTFGIATLNASGVVAGAFTGDGSPFGASAFNSTAIYLVVGNGTTIGNSTQAGIFALTTVPNLFPADVTGGATAVSYNVRTIADLQALSAFSGSETDTAGTGAANRDVLNLVNLVPIPEPSVALLGALGVLGLIRRRR